MKKHLLKISIGTIAFVVFIAIGCPYFFTPAQVSSTPKQVNKSKGLINRNSSGHYTRATGNKTKNAGGSKYSRVIYIGESTEGLLD